MPWGPGRDREGAGWRRGARGGPGHHDQDRAAVGSWSEPCPRRPGGHVSVSAWAGLTCPLGARLRAPPQSATLHRAPGRAERRPLGLAHSSPSSQAPPALPRLGASWGVGLEPAGSTVSPQEGDNLFIYCLACVLWGRWRLSQPPPTHTRLEQSFSVPPPPGLRANAGTQVVSESTREGRREEDGRGTRFSRQEEGGAARRGTGADADSCCRARSGGEGWPACPRVLFSGDHTPTHATSFPVSLACTCLHCRYCIKSELHLDS